MEQRESQARWQSESGVPQPARIHPVDDRLSADIAFRRIGRGEFLLYTGDFRNARQLLAALGRRLDKANARAAPRGASLVEAFRAERRARLAEAERLSRVIVRLDGNHRLELSHAPDVAEACLQTWGPPPPEGTLVALRELLGVLGAAEWRKKGIEVRALGGARMHPHYGVFSPTRQEYVDLVASAPAPKGRRILELGTGTGVLACVLARAGAASVHATDLDPRAVACARDNVDRLGLSAKIRVDQADLFPGEERADLVVFNPPWIPEPPKTPIDRAIYDPEGSVLQRFLDSLPAHLSPGGEAWLVISDLAERLGLRPAGALLGQIAQAGLQVRWTRTTPPQHSKAKDAADPLHAARSQEQVAIHCLAVR